ncbi:hypothetical protein HanXRQr2_Chr10g0418581 [Helianthus annuus]|uniref:Uncharacterized protein n=1 Tax=Helianthus annuus TaxID=4232 RepID=A0A251TF95_HELAN|nr:hypothetical protein HanXRQr2_Chr10g0418581 [Helianthus annuus]KAJ0512278.1 hypothetical protein HanHA300_Chr10g0344381 [Helianthus annuus]KAJ0528372.1 hypothetical protein HanHA89_Chr10g0365601 [Helianthus annuus]KAJ0798778.1 hypothetical protein HanLR1_Chr00c2651g0851921 [Helianthus annuus]
MEESPEVKNRRLQRELMAAAAEKRMAASAAVAKSGGSGSGSVVKSVCSGGSEVKSEKVDECEPMVKEEKSSGEELALEQARQLFSMVFGNEVSKGILAQWSNQGIRYGNWLPNAIQLYLLLCMCVIVL